VRDWGQLQWARPILDVVFDGTADAVDLQLSALLGDSYVRLQTRLDTASDDFDDASAENLTALRAEAEGLIAALDADIDRLCERLSRGRAAGRSRGQASRQNSVSSGAIWGRERAAASAWAGVIHVPWLADRGPAPVNL
jgi:hypothetical protein